MDNHKTKPCNQIYTILNNACFRDQAQEYIKDPTTWDSRRGLKRSWKESNQKEADKEQVAGSSSDGQQKLTSADKGIYLKNKKIKFILSKKK